MLHRTGRLNITAILAISARRQLKYSLSIDVHSLQSFREQNDLGEHGRADRGQVQSVDQVGLERIPELPQLGRWCDVTRQNGERQALRAVLARHASQMKVAPLRRDPARPETARQRALGPLSLLRRAPAPVRLLHYDQNQGETVSTTPRLDTKFRLPAKPLRSTRAFHRETSVESTDCSGSLSRLSREHSPVNYKSQPSRYSRRSELSNFQICQIRFSNRRSTSSPGSPTCHSNLSNRW